MWKDLTWYYYYDDDAVVVVVVVVMYTLYRLEYVIDE